MCFSEYDYQFRILKTAILRKWERSNVANNEHHLANFISYKYYFSNVKIVIQYRANQQYQIQNERTKNKKKKAVTEKNTKNNNIKRRKKKVSRGKKHTMSTFIRRVGKRESI